MGQESSSSARPSKGGWIFFASGVVIALIVGWLLFPLALYSKQAQPINFNHALHMDPERVDGIDGDTEAERCLYCHEFREDGTFAGIPGIQTCVQCHDDPEFAYTESENERRFLREYVADEREIPWLVYSQQPDCVYFSHMAHVAMGEVECRVCHGDHGQSETLKVYMRNRLTGYSIDIWGRRITGLKSNTWDRMKMDDCADCHQQRGHAELDACFVCHK